MHEQKITENTRQRKNMLLKYFDIWKTKICINEWLKIYTLGQTNLK